MTSFQCFMHLLSFLAFVGFGFASVHFWEQRDDEAAETAAIMAMLSLLGAWLLAFTN